MLACEKVHRCLEKESEAVFLDGLSHLVLLNKRLGQERPKFLTTSEFCRVKIGQIGLRRDKPEVRNKKNVLALYEFMGFGRV